MSPVLLHLLAGMKGFWYRLKLQAAIATYICIVL
jgi:hypothetical protein